MTVEIMYGIEGMEGLEKALKELRHEMGGKEGNIVGKALMKAAYPVWRDAQSRAPISDASVRNTEAVGQAVNISFDGGRVNVTGLRKPKDLPGRLRRSIRRVRMRNPKYLNEVVGIGVLMGDNRDDDTGAYYGRFVEFGTVKMEAQPFLRPALEGNRGLAVKTFAADAGRQIESNARRIGKKYENYGDRRTKV